MLFLFNYSYFLKVSHPPYLFEAFLKNEIDPEKSEARVGKEKIEFTLQKSSPCNWQCLSLPLEKDEANTRRTEALQVFEAQQKKISQDKKGLKNICNFYMINYIKFKYTVVP